MSNETKSKAAKRGAAGARTNNKNAASGPSVSKPLLYGSGAAFAAAFAAFVAFTNNTPAPPTSAIGGPFQLTAQTGQQFTEKDMLGRPFLVFFGYTHCPDICHTTLFEMSEILRAMGADAKVGALFVTVDPDRDTPEVLKDYLANFDQRIIGITGGRETLDPMLREYRIYSKKVPGKDGDYAVDHTTVVYLMDKNGRFVSAFNVTRKPQDGARELAKYL